MGRGACKGLIIVPIGTQNRSFGGQQGGQGSRAPGGGLAAARGKLMARDREIETWLLEGKTVCGGPCRGSTSVFLSARPSPGNKTPSRFHMPIAVGSKAPDFTLKTKTAEGVKEVSLRDNLGRNQI